MSERNERFRRLCLEQLGPLLRVPITYGLSLHQPNTGPSLTASMTLFLPVSPGKNICSLNLVAAEAPR